MLVPRAAAKHIYAFALVIEKNASPSIEAKVHFTFGTLQESN